MTSDSVVLPTSTAPRVTLNYAHNPMIVYWEVTRACALACAHCRAEAMPTRHPQELSRAEGSRLLQQIVEFGAPLPHLILTGGDPLTRSDLFDLIDEANALGLQVSITPSATPNLTEKMLEQLRSHHIQSLGLSLDGSTAQRHDAIRNVPGCFDWTIRAVQQAAELGLPLQVNTLVSSETASDLPDIYDQLTAAKVMRWSLFFLIAVGRGRVLQELSPEDGEQLMSWIYDLAQIAPFAIKTTEAPSYRRVALNRMHAAGMRREQIHRSALYRGFGVRDGHGIMFVSNTGEITPAGFLPLATGNVRHDHVVDVYRNAPVFRALHDPRQFKGKCGDCEYRVICGGSRARAFAYTGDLLASDPFCPYMPARGSKPLSSL